MCRSELLVFLESPSVAFQIKMPQPFLDTKPQPSPLLKERELQMCNRGNALPFYFRRRSWGMSLLNTKKRAPMLELFLYINVISSYFLPLCLAAASKRAWNLDLVTGFFLFASNIANTLSSSTINLRMARVWIMVNRVAIK
jgi:hypothetical protein